MPMERKTPIFAKDKVVKSLNLTEEIGATTPDMPGISQAPPPT